MPGQMGVFEHVGLGDGSVLMSAQDYALGVNSDRFKAYSRRSLRFESLPLHEL